MYQPKVLPTQALSNPLKPQTNLSIYIHLDDSQVPVLSLSTIVDPPNNVQKTLMEVTEVLSNLFDTLYLIPPESSGTVMVESLLPVQSTQSQSVKNDHASYQESMRVVDAKIPFGTSKRAAGEDINAAQLTRPTAPPILQGNRLQFSLLHELQIPEDLNYSLRSFIAMGPVEEANALYARIAVREGLSTVGHVNTAPVRLLNQETNWRGLKENQRIEYSVSRGGRE